MTSTSIRQGNTEREVATEGDNTRDNIELETMSPKRLVTELSVSPLTTSANASFQSIMEQNTSSMIPHISDQ